MLKRPLSSPLFDAIWPNGVVRPFSILGVNRSYTLEVGRVVGQRYFFDSLFSSVDCFGTRKEKHHSCRFLGVQRAGKSLGFELFCHLSSRFGRRTDDIGAAAPVHQKSVLEMARGLDGKKGEKALSSTQEVRDRGWIGFSYDLFR